MAQQRFYLREWRQFRQLTQERLADRLGITKQHVSDLERGRRQYNQALLEGFADALTCEPADLLMRDPTSPQAIWSIWDQIPPVDRDQALKVLNSFIPDGKRKRA
jgi:transcriptional regulator with XRE-family HTH domain